MEFLHTMLRPLVDTYTYSAFCLNKLVGQSLSEKDFVQEILKEIKTNFDQGIVNYGKIYYFFLKWRLRRNTDSCESPEDDVDIVHSGLKPV